MCRSTMQPVRRSPTSSTICMLHGRVPHRRRQYRRQRILFVSTPPIVVGCAFSRPSCWGQNCFNAQPAPLRSRPPRQRPIGEGRFRFDCFLWPNRKRLGSGDVVRLELRRALEGGDRAQSIEVIVGVRPSRHRAATGRSSSTGRVSRTSTRTTTLRRPVSAGRTVQRHAPTTSAQDRIHSAQRSADAAVVQSRTHAHGHSVAVQVTCVEQFRLYFIVSLSFSG